MRVLFRSRPDAPLYPWLARAFHLAARLVPVRGVPNLCGARDGRQRRRRRRGACEGGGRANAIQCAEGQFRGGGRPDRCAAGIERSAFRRTGGAGAGTRNAPEKRRLSRRRTRSEEHTSELQSLMRISYAVFCLKKKKQITIKNNKH